MRTRRTHRRDTWRRVASAAIIMLSLAFAPAAPSALAQSRSELTDELDLLAIELFDTLQPRSIADRTEYCGVLGYDASETLIATAPTRGNEDGCNPGLDPPGFVALASYHTHGAYSPDADSEVPSLDDLENDFAEGIDGYVATPAGRVWLNLVEEQVSVLLCGPDCVPADPAFRPCLALPPGDTQTIASLEERDVEDTGVC